MRVQESEQGAFPGLGCQEVIGFTGVLVGVPPLLGRPNPSGYVIGENLTAVGFLPEPFPINIVEFLELAYTFIGLVEGRDFH